MELLNIALAGDLPALATAIHDGHLIREGVAELLEVDDETRFREEDPFTGIMTGFSGNRIIGNFSRFEYDLNRPPDKAIYVLPEDAWGIRVWKSAPAGEIVRVSRELYAEAYQQIREVIQALLEKFGRLVVYDLHSYNYRRNGPDAPPEDQEFNPEVNLGTGAMDRQYWSSVIERFMGDMKNINFMGRKLDVRENIKFRGGWFPRWIRENFGESVCCLSIEFRKFFMDEWTGTPDYPVITALRETLGETLKGVLEELEAI